MSITNYCDNCRSNRSIPITDCKVERQKCYSLLRFCIALTITKIEASEYVGKMNFYLSLLDKQEMAPEENPSIGIFRFGHPKLQTCQDWPNMAGPFLLLNRDTLFETVSYISNTKVFNPWETAVSLFYFFCIAD